MTHWICFSMTGGGQFINLTPQETVMSHCSHKSVVQVNDTHILWCGDCGALGSTTPDRLVTTNYQAGFSPKARRKAKVIDVDSAEPTALVKR